MTLPARTLDPSESLPAVGEARLPATKPGAIVLTRHGEPALSRKCMLTSDGYREWWARYEVGGLLAGQTPPPELLATAAGAGVIFASTRQRAQETAAAISAGREVVSDVQFIEAPLPPPHFPAWFKLPPKYWGAVARFWWHAFNHHEGQETRAEAEGRAARVAVMLIERAETGEDVLVLAHGYFNHMVGKRLKAAGWKLVHNQGFRYWSQRRFEKR
jgi:broad specificity phosphatase PhoE